MPETAVASVELVTVESRVSTGVDAPRHIPALDGVRGIAILMVLAVHLWSSGFLTDGPRIHWLKAIMWSGWSGVDLFFVLSGFLITGILLDTRNDPNRVSVFYKRRALRILPLYYLAIPLAMFAAYLFRQNPEIHKGTPTIAGWISYLFYVQNWYFPLTIGFDRTGLIGQFWSLGIEEQFYLLWPATVWFVLKTRRRFIAACVALCLVAVPIRFLMLLHFGTTSPATLANTFGRMDTLIMGGFCAFAVRDKRLKPALLSALPMIAVFSAAGILICDMIEGVNRGPVTQIFGFSLFAMLYSCVVVWAFVKDGSGNWLDRALRANWLRMFGKYSYGIYVYHGAIFGFALIFAGGKKWYAAHPAFGVIASVLVVAASYLVAALSFRFYESWFLRKKDYSLKAASGVEWMQ